MGLLDAGAKRQFDTSTVLPHRIEPQEGADEGAVGVGEVDDLVALRQQDVGTLGDVGEAGEI